MNQTLALFFHFALRVVSQLHKTSAVNFNIRLLMTTRLALKKTAMITHVNDPREYLLSIVY